MKHSVFRKNKFGCAQCRSSFASRSALSTHISRRHEHKSHCVCRACDMNFICSRRLSAHKQTQHSGQPQTKPKAAIGCAHCLQTLSSKYMLRHHIDRLHNGAPKTLKCNLCPSLFLMKHQLKRHQTYRHEEKPRVNCELCSKSFKHATHLKKHAYLCHSDERPFSCHICRKTFKTPADLRDHSAVHASDRKVFACNQCAAVYITRTGLRVHVNTVHTPAFIGKYKCGRCNAAFTNKQCLRGHQVVHIDAWPYRCAKCLALFKTRGNITKHMAKHSEPRSSMCTLCCHRVKHKSTLRRHYLNKHGDRAGRREFQCAKCLSAFPTKVELALHHTVHGKQRLHHCSLCPASFKHHSNLHRHEKLHSAKMAFRCEECFTCFKTSNGLLHHDVAVHSGAAESSCCVCAICARSSTTKGSLLQHIAKTHFREKKSCARCEHTFANRMDLLCHLRLMHQEVCCKLFGNRLYVGTLVMIKSVPCRSSRMRGIYRRNPAKPFRCSCCLGAYKQASSLELHLCIDRSGKPLERPGCPHVLRIRATDKRQAVGSPPFTCDICPSIFKHLKHLRSHQAIHERSSNVRNSSGKPLVCCDQCDVCYDNKGSLQRHHAMRHRAPRPRLYRCTNCPKSFATVATLNLHARTHSEEHPFACNQCSRSFRTNGARLQHCRESHGTVKPFYPCELCSSTFQRASQLSNHYENQHLSTTYRCAVCGITFSRRNSLVAHVLTHYANKRYVCEICQRGFDAPRRLKTHRLIHSSDRPFQCSWCSVGFVRPWSLISHLSKHNSDSLRVCKPCERKFPSEAALTVHRLRYHTSNIAQRLKHCNICNKSVRNRTQLVIHMRLHSGDKPFKCPLCPAALASQAAAVVHHHSHKLSKQYSCSVCNATFGGLVDLARHTRSLHKRIVCQCALCAVWLPGRAELITHVYSHSGLRPFKCPYCAECFKSKPLVTSHRHVEHAINKATKRVKCVTCLATFKSAYNLKQHQIVHVTEKTHGCAHCSTFFKGASRLLRHLNFKHNPSFRESVTCRLCDVAFYDKYGYQQHVLLRHSSSETQKPFKCGQCLSSFPIKAYLRAHMRRHSSDRPFKCSDCGATFKRGSTRNSHVRAKHKPKLDPT